jgi:hypothetical protein
VSTVLLQSARYRFLGEASMETNEPRPWPNERPGPRKLSFRRALWRRAKASFLTLVTPFYLGIYQINH